MAKINKVRLSGQTYDIEDSYAAKTVSLTQEQYDALAVKDPNTFYIITDAQGADLSNYYTKSETSGATEISTALNAKQDTLVSGTNIKTINNESILGSGNIEIQGGGKAVSAGTNISITTGETADTINCTLNISNGTGTKSIKIGDGVTASGNKSFAGGDDAIASGNWSFAFGRGYATNNYAFAANGNSKATRDYSAAFNSSEANNTYAFSCGTSKASGYASFASGWDNKSLNNYESSFGYYNLSNKANNTFGDSGNTLFSVGNGTADNARHNAFEIRQNGDIYISSGGTDIKLQDHLGGGGGGTSYTAGDGIDITNDVISVTGKVDTTTFNTYSGSVDTALSGKQDTLSAGTGISIVDNVISATGGGGGGTSYTAGDGIDITNDVISVTGKVDTSTYNTYTAATDTALASKQTTLTAGTGIDITDNVISATGGGGGGKAIEAGRGISITTGETADTVSFNLPISAGTNALGVVANAIKMGEGTTAASVCSFAMGTNTLADGYRSFAGGVASRARGESTFAYGTYIDSLNIYETSFGRHNVSNKANSTFGDSGNTLFSVGNGQYGARHNAFEIRQNGDIYITSGNTDIKLQDNLGGGGSSYTAGDGIDITNDVISVTGKVDTSTYETYTAATATAIGNKLSTSDFNTYSGTVDTAINSKASQSDLSTLSGTVTAHTANTDIHVTTAQTAAWNAKSDFSGSYNDLTDKPTIPTVPTSNTAFTNDAGYITSDAISGKADTSAVTESINAAVSGKVDTSTFNTYSGSVETALSGKQDTLSAGTNITIVDNVISAEGGGGKAVSGGTNISITTGETADTINCTLPITADTDGSVNEFLVGNNNTIGSDTNKNIVIGDNNTTFGQGGTRHYSGATIIGYNNNVGCFGIQNDRNDWSSVIGRRNKVNGGNSYIIGVDNNFYNVTSKKNYHYIIGVGNDESSINTDTQNVFVFGAYNKITKSDEFALGKYNTSSSDGTTSGNTFFAIGNGTSNSARHNAFEIRQNGDIYLNDGSKLQDTVSATTANTTALGGLSLVKLTQAQYDALATKDSNVLYVIVG